MSFVLFTEKVEVTVCNILMESVLKTLLLLLESSHNQWQNTYKCIGLKIFVGTRTHLSTN